MGGSDETGYGRRVMVKVMVIVVVVVVVNCMIVDCGLLVQLSSAFARQSASLRVCCRCCCRDCCRSCCRRRRRYCWDVGAERLCSQLINGSITSGLEFNQNKRKMGLFHRVVVRCCCCCRRYICRYCRRRCSQRVADERPLPADDWPLPITNHLSILQIQPCKPYQKLSTFPLRHHHKALCPESQNRRELE